MKKSAQTNFANHELVTIAILTEPICASSIQFTYVIPRFVT
jgi:hypothetical protein